MIRLEPVCERTFRDIVNMKLSEEQNRFVASNIYSLAQAWLYYDAARPLAVCNDDDIVGFMMLDWDEDERTVGIWRFMIAPEHQRKGYGRKALEAAVELVRGAGVFDMIYLDYVPENTVARELYYSIGFRENGDVENGEIIMTMPLTDSPKVGMLTADEDDADDFIELIEAERAAGNPVPPELGDSDSIERAAADKKITRFTLMGDTIGLAFGNTILLGSEYASRMSEAKALFDRKR